MNEVRHTKREVEMDMSTNYTSSQLVDDLLQMEDNFPREHTQERRPQRSSNVLD